MLKKYSLQRQLIIIFVLIAVVVVAVLVPLINKNLTDLIDNQMYETLELAQNRYINFDFAPIENTSSKQIYHMKYYPSDGTDSSNNGTLIPTTSMTKDDAYTIYNVLADDLALMIEQNKTTVHGKGSDLLGDTVYYLINNSNGTYVISALYGDYSDDLISDIQQQIINIMYFALAIVAIVIFIWVSSLIKPLRQITKYIENVRKDKEVLKKGSVKIVYKDYGIISYGRFYKDDVMLVAVNNTGEEKELNIPVKNIELRSGDTLTRRIISTENDFSTENVRYEVILDSVKVTMPPFSSIILEKDK